MAVTKITYAADEAIAVTEWDSTLGSQQFATSAIFDNTTNLYVDVLVGGFLDFTGTSAVAGDTLDIYVVGNYDVDTAADMGGGIDALLIAATELTEDTAFVRANMKLLTSVSLHSATPTSVIGYQWGPESIASVYGSMPQKFMLVLHCNSASSMAGTSSQDVNAVGITYTTA